MKPLHWSTIVIAYLSFVALGLFDGTLGVSWPSLRDEFGVTNDALGILLAGLTLGHVSASFLNGTLIRRRGIAFVLLSSATLMAIGLFLQSQMRVWWLLLTVTFFYGMGIGLLDAGMNTFAAEKFRPRLMNWLHASFALGTTAGAWLMTATLAQNRTWRFGILIIALLNIAVLITLYLTKNRWQLADEATPDQTTDHRPSTINTLRLPIVLITIAFFFLYTGVEVGLGHWAYTIMTESRGIDLVTAGSWSGGYWFAFFIGRVILGFIETNPIRLVRLGLVGAILGLALFMLNPFPIANIIALAIVGFSVAPIFPALVALTPERVGLAHAPNAIGFEIGMAGLGVAILPGIGGLLAETFTLEAVPIYILAISLLLFLLHEIILRTAQ